jgi:hypothetical protein
VPVVVAPRFGVTATGLFRPVDYKKGPNLNVGAEVLETNPMQGGPARRHGAVDQDDTRSADNHCFEYLRDKEERDSKIRKCSYPRGVASSWVLHQCGDEKTGRSLVEMGVSGSCNARETQEND